MVADDLFYVFVDVGRKPSDSTVSYVLPSSVVAGLYTGLPPCVARYSRQRRSATQGQQRASAVARPLAHQAEHGGGKEHRRSVWIRLA